MFPYIFIWTPRQATSDGEMVDAPHAAAELHCSDVKHTKWILHAAQKFKIGNRKEVETQYAEVSRLFERMRHLQGVVWQLQDAYHSFSVIYSLRLGEIRGLKRDVLAARGAAEVAAIVSDFTAGLAGAEQPLHEHAATGSTGIFKVRIRTLTGCGIVAIGDTQAEARIGVASLQAKTRECEELQERLDAELAESRAHAAEKRSQDRHPIDDFLAKRYPAAEGRHGGKMKKRNRVKEMARWTKCTDRKEWFGHLLNGLV
jgi:hypothetical protein